jgi:hypothetical protein
LTLAARLAYRERSKGSDAMTRAPAAFTIALALLLAAMGCDGEGETAITDIDPQAGATQGNQSVRIHGKNFRTDIGYTVYFGNARAKQVTILDESTLLVSSPESREPGTVDVVITADDGPAWKVREGFRYEDMAGSVVEKLGEQEGEAKGKLAY